MLMVNGEKREKEKKISIKSGRVTRVKQLQRFMKEGGGPSLGGGGGLHHPLLAGKLTGAKKKKGK